VSIFLHSSQQRKIKQNLTGIKLRKNIITPKSPYNLYFVIAMKRSGHHGFINWLCSQHGNITHHNDPTQDWAKEEFKGRKITQYGAGKDLCINLEDFDMDDYQKYDFPNMDIVKNCINFYCIILVRDFPNWVASSFNRKTCSNNTYKDVYFNLNISHINSRGILKESRIKLWEKQIHLFEEKPDNFILVNYNKWLTNETYRKELVSELNVNLNDKSLLTTSNFGQGSSFDGMKKNKVNPDNIQNRYKKLLNTSEYMELMFQNTHLIKISNQHIFKIDLNNNENFTQI